MLRRVKDIYYDGNLRCALPATIRGATVRYPRVEHVGGVQDGWPWKLGGAYSGVSGVSGVYETACRLSIGSKFKVFGTLSRSVWMILGSTKFDGFGSGTRWRVTLDALEVHVDSKKQGENLLRVFTVKNLDDTGTLGTALILPYYPSLIDADTDVQAAWDARDDARSFATAQKLKLVDNILPPAVSAAFNMTGTPPNIFSTLIIQTKDGERIWSHTGEIMAEEGTVPFGDVIAHTLVLTNEVMNSPYIVTEGQALEPPAPIFSRVSYMKMTIDGTMQIVAFDLSGRLGGLEWPSPTMSVASESGGWAELGRPTLSENGLIKMPVSGTRFPLTLMLVSEKDGWKQVGVFREVRRSSSLSDGITNDLEFECLYGSVLSPGTTIEIPVIDDRPTLLPQARFLSAKNQAVADKMLQEKLSPEPDQVRIVLGADNWPQQFQWALVDEIVRRTPADRGKALGRLSEEWPKLWLAVAWDTEVRLDENDREPKASFGVFQRYLVDVYSLIGDADEPTLMAEIPGQPGAVPLPLSKLIDIAKDPRAYGALFGEIEASRSEDVEVLRAAAAFDSRPPPPPPADREAVRRAREMDLENLEKLRLEQTVRRQELERVAAREAQRQAEYRVISEAEARKAEVMSDGKVEDVPIRLPAKGRKISWDD